MYFIRTILHSASFRKLKKNKFLIDGFQFNQNTKCVIDVYQWIHKSEYRVNFSFMYSYLFSLIVTRENLLLKLFLNNSCTWSVPHVWLTYGSKNTVGIQIAVIITHIGYWVIWISIWCNLDGRRGERMKGRWATSVRKVCTDEASNDGMKVHYCFHWFVAFC